MIVVKLGGSLFEHPLLAQGLRTYLESLAPAEVLLIPGGGDVVEAIRKLDRIHGLGEEASHWLALQAMKTTAAFVGELIDLPSFGSRVQIPNCLAFLREDEGRPGALPHTWDVTADSIAARVAIVLEAERLILLKSIDIPPGMSWTEAADTGWVDRHFPRAVEGIAEVVESVNFAKWMGFFPK